MLLHIECRLISYKTFQIFCLSVMHIASTLSWTRLLFINLNEEETNTSS